MFDYQAGEKYKMTMIMVALAGLLGGIFIATLLIPSNEAPPSRRRQQAARHANDPDVTGQARYPAGYGQNGSEGAAQAAQQAAIPTVDPYQARTFIDQWLPLAWDLSAGSARTSQEQAISCMTTDCANAYRQNIWTASVAKQIEESGLKSSFQPDDVNVGELRRDGTIVVTVTGKQQLAVGGRVVKARNVKLEYLLKNANGAIRIAGISEGNQAAGTGM